jgi:hypothetical protein
VNHSPNLNDTPGDHVENKVVADDQNPVAEPFEARVSWTTTRPRKQSESSDGPLESLDQSSSGTTVIASDVVEDIE